MDIKEKIDTIGVIGDTAEARIGAIILNEYNPNTNIHVISCGEKDKVICLDKLYNKILFDDIGFNKANFINMVKPTFSLGKTLINWKSAGDGDEIFISPYESIPYDTFSKSSVFEIYLNMYENTVPSDRYNFLTDEGKTSALQSENGDIALDVKSNFIVNESKFIDYLERYISNLENVLISDIDVSIKYNEDDSIDKVKDDDGVLNYDLFIDTRRNINSSKETTPEDRVATVEQDVFLSDIISEQIVKSIGQGIVTKQNTTDITEYKFFYNSESTTDKEAISILSSQDDNINENDITIKEINPTITNNEWIGNRIIINGKQTTSPLLPPTNSKIALIKLVELAIHLSKNNKQVTQPIIDRINKYFKRLENKRLADKKVLYYANDTNSNFWNSITLNEQEKNIIQEFKNFGFNSGGGYYRYDNNNQGLSQYQMAIILSECGFKCPIYEFNKGGYDKQKVKHKRDEYEKEQKEIAEKYLSYDELYTMELMSKNLI